MNLFDYEENWKNSEIAGSFIDIYERQQAALEKEASLAVQAEKEALAELELQMEASAQRRYRIDYLRVKAEVELTEMKASLTKLAQQAIKDKNEGAALLIEATISDLNLVEEDHA